jgi:hypothetical protein
MTEKDPLKVAYQNNPELCIKVILIYLRSRRKMSSSRQRPVWSEIIFSTHILCFSVFTNNYKYAGVILCYITNIIKHKTK